MVSKIMRALLGWLALTILMFPACDDEPMDPPSGAIQRFDHTVLHAGIIPNFEDVVSHLYVREKVNDSLLLDDLEGRVALLIHATITPSETTFDLNYQDYSLMEALAARGLDVFCFDLTGYGRSSYPAPMNDFCNLDSLHRQLIGLGPCAPTYPFFLTTMYSELAEIDRVVDFIRILRGVERVNLFGVSLGGIRALNYTMTHPGKVNRLAVQGVGRYLSFSLEPTQVPAAGYPLNIVTEATLLERLEDDVVTSDQRDQAIHAAIWQELSAIDTLGQGWGTGGSRYPNTMIYGFTRSDVEQMSRPCLVLSGENDRILNPFLPIRTDFGLALYNDMLSAPQRIHLTLEKTGHIPLYDLRAPYLREALADWLLHGNLQGVTNGEGTIDEEGNYLW